MSMSGKLEAVNREGRRALLLSLLAGMCSPVFGLSLLERSPFIWPGFEARTEQPKRQAKPAEVKELEFHAVYRLGGDTHVLVSEPRGQNYRWLRIGESDDDLEARSYDAETNTVQLWRNGEELVLTLKDLPDWQPNHSGDATASRRRMADNSSEGSTVTRAERSGRVNPVTQRRRSIRRPEGRSGSNGDGEREGRRAQRPEDIGISKPSFTPPRPDVDKPPTEPPSFVPKQD